MAQRTLKRLYLREKNKPTHAKTFIKELAKVTIKSEWAVRKWISGEIEPEDETKKVISEYLDIPVEELFPQKKKRYGK